MRDSVRTDDAPVLPKNPVAALTDRQPRQLQHYIHSVALVVVATLLGLPLRPLIEPTNLVMLYLLVVVVAASRFGRRFAVLTSVLSVAAFDFVFVPPYYTYAVADAEYLLTFAGLLVVGVVISTLAAQAREQARLAHRREAQTVALYKLNHDLALSAERNQVADAVVSHVERTFDIDGIILLSNGERLEVHGVSAGRVVGDGERDVAAWVQQHGEPAGRDTHVFSEADGYYLPLTTAHEVLGVLGVFCDTSDRTLTPEQHRLLESFAGQAALAIDRVQLAEKARQAQLLRETEKLQTALLNSISHDLRTPLASITGALSSLRTESDVLDETAQRDLLDTAWEEAERLNTLVGNLLDMTRLESGALKVSHEPCDVQDVIGAALSRLSHQLEDRPVSVTVPPDLPFVPLDFVLSVQVLVNVLDNAIKYSPTDTPIEIAGRRADNQAILEVRDCGVGIPGEELDRVFDKFYRVQRENRVSADGTGGTGLGLSISKGIVEAHGGRIWARKRPGGGTVISIALPLERDETTSTRTDHERT